MDIIYEGLPLKGGDIRLVTILPSKSEPESDSDSAPVQCRLGCYRLMTPRVDHNVKLFLEDKGAYWDDSATLDDGRIDLLDLADHPRKSRFKNYFRKATRLSRSQAPASNLKWRYAWGDYIALSYTWGDSKDPAEIYINEQPMMVTRNLEAALRSLRKKLPIRLGIMVWIDAICIDQGNIPEKNVEVRRMWEIYKQAFDVLVYLGEDGNDSMKGMKLIKELSFSWNLDKGVLLKKALADDNFSLDPNYQKGDSTVNGDWHALYHLVRRPYWTRVWTIQELFMGSSKSPIVCGNQTVTFQQLTDAVLRWLDVDVLPIVRRRMAVERLVQGTETWMSGEMSKVWSKNASWEENVNAIGGLVQHIGVDGVKGSLAGTQISNWVIQSDRLALIKKLHEEVDTEHPLVHPMNILELVRSSDATLAHDKVYSILGFIDPKLRAKIISDYKRSEAEVFQEFCIVWIQASESLDFLCNCMWTDDLTFPSWVPDWRIKSIPRLLPTGISPNPYHAGGDWLCVEIPPESSLLTTKVVIAGIIDGLSMCEEYIEGDTISQPKGFYHYHGDSNEGTNEATIQDTLWRTFLGNRTLDFQIPEPEFGDFRALLDIPLPERIGGHHVGYLPEPFDSSFYNFIEKNAKFQIGTKRLEQYWPNGGRREPVSGAADEYDARLFKKVLMDSIIRAMMMTSSRRIFTTYDGLIGLSPAETRPGDVIVIVPSCSVPLAVRVDDIRAANVRGRIVGACYAHGLMEGEYMSDLAQGSRQLDDLILY